MPTVAYIGNFSVPFTTENEVARAFEHLGWTVVRIPEVEFIEACATGRLQHIAAAAWRSALVLHTMTQGNMPRADRVVWLWRECLANGIPTASIHLDLFYGLGSPKQAGPQRHDLPREHPMFRVAHVFTADGGHDELWKRDGVNHTWLPPGVSHIEDVDVEPFPELVGRYDVGFCGSDVKYHAEWPHRVEMVSWLRDTYGDRFLHAAGGSTHRTIRGLELNRVYASVPVWVGDSCLTAPDFAYWSDRVPETWGRGGFLIHPHVHPLCEHYEAAQVTVPGTSWQAGDWSALRECVDQWVHAEDVRHEVRAALAAHTRTYDTYVQRVQTMLGVMGFDVPLVNGSVDSVQLS